VEIAEMDDEVPMLPKKSKLRYQKELEKLTSECKPVSERQ
jgi:hypothetical protein